MRSAVVKETIRTSNDREGITLCYRKVIWRLVAVHVFEGKMLHDIYALVNPPCLASIFLTDPPLSSILIRDTLCYLRMFCGLTAVHVFKGKDATRYIFFFPLFAWPNCLFR